MNYNNDILKKWNFNISYIAWLGEDDWNNEKINGVLIMILFKECI